MSKKKRAAHSKSKTGCRTCKYVLVLPELEAAAADKT